MPPQIRPLSDGSVKPFFLWCMHCQRLCAGRYKRETDRPFEIDCYFNSKGFIHCHQCSHDNTACDSVAPGMLGNGWDYSRILRWATRYWDTQEGNEDEYEWPENVRASIVSALSELNSAFSKTEEAHRREHALTGDNDDVMATYRIFVEKRRRLLDQDPIPGEYACEEEWDCYQSSRLLRLLPGDPGYVLWMVALGVFRGAVEDAITSCAVLRGSGHCMADEDRSRSQWSARRFEGSVVTSLRGWQYMLVAGSLVVLFGGFKEHGHIIQD